jgi:prophage regulatory protein
MDHLLKIGEVAARTRLSKASIYRHVADDTFPRPVRIGNRTLRWREADIEALMEGRPWYILAAEAAA